ncbi:hypothetical protein GCM10027093_60310 [Paraburkholderia jirisanensis]
MFRLESDLPFKCELCGTQQILLSASTRFQETGYHTERHELFPCLGCQQFLSLGYKIIADDDTHPGFSSTVFLTHPNNIAFLNDNPKIIRDPVFESDIEGLSPLDYHRTLLALDELKRNIAGLATLDRRMFEQVVAELFRAKGFKVEVTKKTRDGGTDIIGVINNDGVPFKIFVQCKRNDPGNPTGVDVIRSAYGVHQASNGPNKTIIVSATYFTKDAITFQETLAQSSWHLDLRDYDDIVRWVENHPL